MHAFNLRNCKTNESMSFFLFSTLLVALHAALLSFCIKLAPAQSPSPPFPLLPCSLNSSWISENAPIDENIKNLTVFQLSFLTNQSLSFTFTTTTYSDIEDGGPNLAFITLMRPVLEVQEPSSTCMREKYTSFSEPLRSHLCNLPLPQIILQAPTSCFSEPHPYIDSDEAHLITDVVSLMYDAAAASLHLQANLSNGVTTKEIYLQSNAVDSTVSNESLRVIVGYITGCAGEASIDIVTTGESTMSTSTPSPRRRVSLVVIHDDKPNHSDKSNHKKVGIIVGVIVGVCVLIGLLILLFRSPSVTCNFDFNCLKIC